MTKITNNTRETLNFVVKDKRTEAGEAVTEAVRAAESRDVDVDTESAAFKGAVLSGAISVDKRTTEKVEKAAAKPIERQAPAAGPT